MRAAVVPPPGTKATAPASRRTMTTLRAVVTASVTRSGAASAGSGAASTGRAAQHRLRRRALGKRGLGREAIADAEVRVDVAPVRRRLLELLAQLAHEDVDRPVAARHRVAPDPLVDLFALEHAPLGPGEQFDQLELAAREVDRRAAHEGLEAIRADLDLAGADRPAGRPRLGPPPAAHHGLDPCDELLGMARLGQPVVGAEPQPAHALGHGRLTGADQHAQAGQRGAQLLEVLPGLRTEHGEVDDDRVEAHRHDRVDGDRAGQHAVLPGQALEPLGQHLQEARVGVDDAKSQRRDVGGGGPFRHGASQCIAKADTASPPSSPGHSFFTAGVRV